MSTSDATKLTAENHREKSHEHNQGHSWEEALQEALIWVNAQHGSATSYQDSCRQFADEVEMVFQVGCAGMSRDNTRNSASPSVVKVETNVIGTSQKRTRKKIKT